MSAASAGSGAPCTLWAIAGMFGKQLPQVGRRGFCPIRQHKRNDKTLSVFLSRTSGEPMFKCHSCDPPDNLGDAVALYAAILRIDRKSAWTELREKGYAVPGLEDGPAPRRPATAAAPKPRPQVEGEQFDEVLAFEQAKFHAWAANPTGARERFARQRGLRHQTLIDHDVVDVGPDVIGFGYRDPLAPATITRVKMRPLDRKTFWIEPRPADGERGKADGPLYLSHDLRLPRGGLKTFCVITEGEVDALTLRDQGFSNVVSLPDGAGSANRVDVRPISTGFALWLVATDVDEEGEAAYVKIRERARFLGVGVGRLTFRKGDVVHKDANAALLAGFQRDDFINCIQAAAERSMGYRLRID